MAATDDLEMAQLMGVNIKNIYGLAMGISIATAALGRHSWYDLQLLSDFRIIIFGYRFAVVVIGGMGSIWNTCCRFVIYC